MLNYQQFKTYLKSDNFFIYLGGPSRIRTQSSMIPVLNALGTYNGATNGANLLTLIQAIGNLPANKNQKYSRALTHLYNSFPNFFAVKVNPFALGNPQTLTPGVLVFRQPAVPSHPVDAVLALNQLNGPPSGNALLTALQAQSALGNPRWTEVKCAANTASGGNECAVLEMADNYQTTLASALVGHNANVGACIGLAMTALGHPPGVGGLAPFTWLENQIDNSPVYQLVGQPSVTPSSNTHGAGWISAATLQSWVNGVTTFPTGVAAGAVNDAKVVLGTVLRGGPSRVLAAIQE